MNSRTVVTIILTLLICSFSTYGADLGAELQLKKDTGPTYEETVKFLSKYPGFSDSDGYLTRNLRIDGCIISFETRGYNKLVSGFFKNEIIKSKTHYAVIDLKKVSKTRNSAGGGISHIEFLDLSNRLIGELVEGCRGSCQGYTIFYDSGITTRYDKAFEHLIKLCRAENNANEDADDPF